MNLTLTYGCSSDGLIGFTDADGMSNLDRRAISGYTFLYNGGAISWGSKQQELVALSTTEAEFVAAVTAGQQIIWLRNLLWEFGYSFPTPSTLHIDNMSAVSVAKNPEHSGCMKHLDPRFFWLREAVSDGAIAVFHVPVTL